MPKGIGYVDDGKQMTIREFCNEYAIGDNKWVYGRGIKFVEWYEQPADIKPPVLRTYTEWDKCYSDYCEIQTLMFR